MRGCPRPCPETARWPSPDHPATRGLAARGARESSSMPGMRRTERSRARRDRAAARPPIGAAAASSSAVASRVATIRLAPPKGAPLTAKHPSHYITPMDFETIRLERADGVATITLHRPERLNAWTPVMGRELL